MAQNEWFGSGGRTSRLFVLGLAIAIVAIVLVALGRSGAFYEFFFGYEKKYHFFLNDFHIGNWHLPDEGARAAAYVAGALYVVLGICFPVVVALRALFGRVTFRSMTFAFCALALNAPWYGFEAYYKDYPTPITDTAQLRTLQCRDQRTGVLTVWYYEAADGTIILFHQDGYYNERKLRPATPQICDQIRSRAAARAAEEQRTVEAAAKEARAKAESAAKEARAQAETDAAYRAKLAVTYAGDISGRFLKTGLSKDRRTFELEMNSDLKGGRIWIFGSGILIWELTLEGKMTGKDPFVGRTTALEGKDYHSDDVTLTFSPQNRKVDWFSRDEFLKVELFGTLIAADKKAFSDRMAADAAKRHVELDAQARAEEEEERQRHADEGRRLLPQTIRKYYCEADGLGGNGAGSAEDSMTAQQLAVRSCGERALFCVVSYCARQPAAERSANNQCPSYDANGDDFCQVRHIPAPAPAESYQCPGGTKLMHFASGARCMSEMNMTCPYGTVWQDYPPGCREQ